MTSSNGSSAAIMVLLLLPAALCCACIADNSVGPDSVASGSGSGSDGSDVGGNSSNGTSGTMSPAASGAGGNEAAGAAGFSDVPEMDGGSGNMQVTDAAISEAGVTGPGTPGGPSKCPLAGSMLCDGFENGALDTATWATQGMAVVDTSKAYRGMHSVHITFSGTTPSFITETKTFPAAGTAATNNAMWGRMFVWHQVDSGTAQGHFVFIRAEGKVVGNAPAASSQLHVAGGYKGQFAAEIRTDSDKYKYAMPTIAVPFAKQGWQCWEWHTAADNTLQFYIDGKAVPGMAVTTADKWPFPIFEKLYLGWLQFANGPSGSVWIDEVAISEKQIGCDG